MTKHSISLVFFLLSLLSLLGAFYFPFFSIQLDIDVPKSVDIGKNLIMSGKSTPIIGSKISTFIDYFFGPELFSDTCQENWTECFQDWFAFQIGVTRGDQYLLNMIQDTWNHGELFLGTLIFFFSVIFPVSKVFLGIWSTITSSVPSKQFCYVWLMKTGKWSMTNVFVVALLILFFKAEHIHLHLEAQVGVYLFAVSALCSSIGSQRLGSELGATFSFIDKEASIETSK